MVSISGTTLTLEGSETDFETWGDPGYGYFVRTATLDATRILCAYSRGVASGYHQAFLVAVAIDTGAETLTPGTRVAMGGYPYSSFFSSPTLDVFDDRYYLTGFNYEVAGGEVVGTVITAGSAITTKGGARAPVVACLDTTHWVVAYLDTYPPGNNAKITTGKQSVKVLTKDIEDTEFEADATDALAICKMTSQLFAIAYKETP